MFSHLWRATLPTVPHPASSLNLTTCPESLVGDDGQVRIRDLDIGTRIGLTRPRNIRKTIKAMEEKGKMPGIQTRAVEERVARHGRGEVTMKAREYWLTRAQALKVIAKCETDVADAILDEVIAVYEAAVGSGGIRAAANDSAPLDPLLDLLAAAERRHPGLTASLVDNMGEALALSVQTGRRLSFGPMAAGACPSFVMSCPATTLAEATAYRTSRGVR